MRRPASPPRDLCPMLCALTPPRYPSSTLPYPHPTRLYPLNQRDLPLERKQLDFGPLLPASVAVDNPSRDYTPPQVGWAPLLLEGAWCRAAGAGQPVHPLHPRTASAIRLPTLLCQPPRSPPSPQYITLLFTDLGVLTPAAVSDELIQLYV